MRYPHPVLTGRLVRRYQRFLADVRLDSGELVTAHCPNSGAMTTCAEEGMAVLLSDRGTGPTRRLRYTWEVGWLGRTGIVVNTLIPNRAVAEAIARGRVPELAGFDEPRREVPYGPRRRSRIDIHLQRGERQCFVEVKNATMKAGSGALFPDAVTERGTRHLADLAREARRGHRAVIFFFLGRTDCSWVGAAAHVDPVYAAALRRAVRHGVEALAYRARVSLRGVEVGPGVDVRL